jgi:hypothetical protein
MNLLKNRQVIGITEMIDLPDLGLLNIPAKIDTGAYHSSMWASDVKETKNGLSFMLFDGGSEHYKGELVVVSKFEKSKIRNSFGHEEERYRVPMKIRLGNKVYKTDFTLANRSVNKYPVLLGRKLLKSRFIVDVTQRNVHFNLTKSKIMKKV